MALHDFQLADYQDAFHTLCADLSADEQHRIRTILERRTTGWQQRARCLIRYAEALASAHRNREHFLAFARHVNQPRGPAAGLGKLSSRDRLRYEMTKRSNTQLRDLATALKVSYDAFMRHNNRLGLIDALIDAMLRPRHR